MSTWKVYAKKADFTAIGKKFNVDPVIARIIRNRDIVNMEDIDMYINCKLDRLHSPYDMKDIDKAVKIITDKVDTFKKIRIIGDYDIDGVCSIYILCSALTRLGANVDYVVPDRIEDGYGINERLIDNAVNDKVDTIITCDNGIAALEQIRYAKSMGLNVIVTDHHDIPYREDDDGREYIIPEADAVINPKQVDCNYPFKTICGAVVAWKLVQALYRTFGLDDNAYMEFLEFAAIATVGDVMDLKDENRIIVKEGLKAIAHTTNIGLSELVNACEIDTSRILAYHIGFVLGPCINAGGRLDTAKRGVELFLSKDRETATRMALELKNLNEERKQMTVKQLEVALNIINEEEYQNDTVLVIYLPECHESLAGIIAGRIRENAYKPCIVLTDTMSDSQEHTELKGSGRSIEGYNMFEELVSCSDYLKKFGGHPMAAGLSIKKSNVDILRRKLNEHSKLTPKNLTPVSWIDVPMPVDYVDERIIEQLEILEPFGKGNEKPLFADKNLLVRNIRVFKSASCDVIKFTLINERGRMISAVMFRREPGDLPESGDYISILYYPGINTYNGKSSITLTITEYCVN